MASPWRQFGPLARLAMLWLIGTVLGVAGGLEHGALVISLWLIGAILAALVVLFMLARRRNRAACHWVAILIPCLAAAWFNLHQLPTSDGIRRHLAQEPQLATVTGRVVDEPRLTPAQRGSFARFSWEEPQTFFLLDVQTLRHAEVDQPASGRLLVKLDGADARLQPGATVRVAGWMAPFEGQFNPGDLDMASIMARRGVDGRLTTRGAANITLLSPPGATAGLLAWRQTTADAAAWSLRLGMDDNPTRPRLAFLDTVLLGRWSDDIVPLQESFRRTGLAHLLSISGAHLAILLGLVWLLARAVMPRPRRAALVVLVVLLMYLAVLPMTVPILRAAIMAGLFCLAMASGRRVSALELLAGACLLVLILRPADVANAGFQLSFGITAGLLLFTSRLSRRLYPEPFDETQLHRRRYWVKRWLANVLAANLVGFAIGLPLVAYHFGLVACMAVVWSLPALPLVTLTLGLGFSKIVIGLLLPSTGMALAWPLEWATDGLTGLADLGARLPGVAITLPRQPSLAWVLASLAVVLALLGGWFAGRRRVMTGALGLCVGWLILLQQPAWMQRGLAVFSPSPKPALILSMLSVGDGSCYLLRSPATGKTLMFDCGSGGYMDVATANIVPCLAMEGVDRIDTLMLSHVDLDHICGSVDMADRVAVGRVLISPQFLAAAQREPDGPASHLVTQMTRRGIPVLTVSQGWRERWDDATELRLLWPPAERSFKRTNDSSLVLAVEVAGHRVLLNGDIAQEAMTGLLDGGEDLRADVTDLAHHGSFVPISPRWFAAVNPKLVLQSSGPARLRLDRWSEIIEQANVPRLITHRHGLVTVTLGPNGEITWTTFRP